MLAAGFGIAVAVAKPGVGRGLGAEVEVRSADIGIPGITKMYAATLTNHGFLPARVARCNFITDDMEPGTEAAYAVQRWNESNKQWDTVLQLGKSKFCKPYPLGIVKATFANGWLWPDQNLSTREEAMAARDGLIIGDHARIVIFTGEAGDYSRSVATPSFVVDEHPKSSIDFRVRH